MGSNNRQKKGHSSSSSSSFSIFNFFKSKKGRSKGADQYHYENAGTNSWDEVWSAGKVWPSDEDKCHHWVAEPGIDRKAKAYIDRIHQNRVLETERQTVTLHPTSHL